MKGINTPGQAMERGGVAPFSAPRGGYLTLLSRHSLGNGTMVMLVLLSLRWGMTEKFSIMDGSVSLNSTSYNHCMVYCVCHWRCT
ncbi:MAG: hypothetical protein JEY71_09645 [Sphaerochaeta sp.]|nr:hypothetical protein [Sphaerochaeta sp.]